MKQYKLINNALGWLTFAIAMFTYGSTIEPTASFWDCGEFIATAYKLQIGHPPGAPLFMILGRVATLFAMGDTTKVAMMMNLFSALASALTILFLFWSITHLARKIFLSGKSPETIAERIAIFGSALVGALAYTFSDTFWFSAVEGEVYATSSLFTALVFWAMLKWEEVADQPHADRYIVLIAYLMGLSIGVHLLNLLAIPALAYIFYFRRFKRSRSGLLITAAIGMLLLGFVQFAFIPKVVGTAAWFELLFTNSLGMSFGTGALVYIITLIVLIILSLKFSSEEKEIPAFASLALLILLISGMLIGIIGTGILAYLMLVRKNNFRLANTLTLCITVMLIGYGSYGMIVIRSSADTPMDENNPENVFTLLSYLNREQYGTRPLVYGQYYNAPLDSEKPYKDGNTVYAPDRESGKYIVVSTPKDNQEPNYDKAFSTIFPRMWSSQASHIRGYKNWAEIKNDPKNKRKPSFGQNLKFFFNYQLGFMYLRYFAWNFIGRVNDIQGQGTPATEGGWKSGIAAIDAPRLGTQDDVPPSLAGNKANNAFYFLPLILGLIGMVYQYRKQRKDFLVVMLFFFFTGIAIIIFLNQYTNEPRERDYGFAGSFYAFSIWIGLGVAGLFELLRKYAPATIVATLVTGVSLLAVPGIMAREGWDDHDRSNRYTARDYASNYLNSCAPNAILFTNGDNDTFPLWYAQEVEGIRTDVRVVNLSLLNTDWYIDQIRRKAYDSEPVPISFKPAQYRQGKREQIIITDKGLKGYQDIREMIGFVASDDPNLKFRYDDRLFDYFPSDKFSIPVDSAAVIANGTVPAYLAGQVVKSIDFSIDRQYVLKADLMILDLLAHNNWKRPVYFAITVGDESYLGLQDYFQLEGLAYRLVPVKNPPSGGRGDNFGRVEADLMYKNVMEKYRWGGVDQNILYMDENNLRMTMNLRSTFDRLASSLLEQGRKDSAIKVLDRAFEVLPERNVPYNFFVINLADDYYKAGATEKADKILKRYAEILEQETRYYFRQKKNIYNQFAADADRNMSIFNFLMQVARRAKRDNLVKELGPLFDKLEAERPVTAVKPALN
jgi:tetratricopeptide (TPR) repeat protein